MTQVAGEVRINAPREQVWEALADFGGIYKFNPTVPKSYSTSEANGGVGATRHCDLAVQGASIEERIVEWQEGEKYAIEIYDGQKSPPFKSAVAQISVAEDGNGSVVRGKLDYELKYGPIGSLMDAVMVKSQFNNAWNGLFAGLKHYVETGEEVNGLDGLDLSAVESAAV